jgi:hypothetical protein
VIFLSTGSIFRTFEVCPNPITRGSVFTFWSTKRHTMTLSALFDLRHWFLSASAATAILSDTDHTILDLALFGAKVGHGIYHSFCGAAEKESSYWRFVDSPQLQQFVISMESSAQIR